MIRHNDSHLDHNLTAEQIAWIFAQFADRNAFFNATVELPEELGMVPCGLHGPIMGDAPVEELEVSYEKRGTRTYTSRMTERAPRMVRSVTVIAGPHEETCARCQGNGMWYGLAIPPDNGPFACHECVDGKVVLPCVLYTAFGGPLAPQEPNDPGCKDPVASRAFWSEHALSK